MRSGQDLIVKPGKTVTDRGTKVLYLFRERSVAVSLCAADFHGNITKATGSSLSLLSSEKAQVALWDGS